MKVSRREEKVLGKLGNGEAFFFQTTTPAEGANPRAHAPLPSLEEVPVVSMGAIQRGLSPYRHTHTHTHAEYPMSSDEKNFL